MRRRFICTALAVAAAAVAAPAGAATGTLDQQQTESNGSNASATGGRPIGQTFTAGLTGGLDGIEVLLRRAVASEDPLTLEIRDVRADGMPGDAVLASATVAPSSVPSDIAGWVSVALSPAAAVTSGARYTIVGSTGVSGVYSFLAHPDAYAGGHMWFTNPEATWEPFAFHGGTPFDMAFKTYVTASHSFGGFADPIDPNVVNTAKAGATIPVRWHLEAADGTPISDPASFVSVTSRAGNGACAGQPADAVEDYSGGSGLQYLGGGDWQFNWKTSKTYASQCRTLVLTLSDGSTHTAGFQFK